mgnify:CR=1 FL=1
MSEDSIFIVNVEHYHCVPDEKILPKTRLNCLFFVYVGFGEEKENRLKYS